MENFGARNARGFSQQIQYGQLPSPTHLTYQGIFNQIKFNVGLPSVKPLDLHLGYARYQFKQSSIDNEIHDYLAIFVKGAKDGQPRDQRPLNAVICLDISGSMSGSRLSLSVQAIKMFISRMRPNDSLGMVTFNNEAQIVFTPTLRANITDEIYDKLDAIKAGGGTTIKHGFQTSASILKQFLQQNQYKNAQNRLIMLTDVCDNTISDQRKFIDKVSQQNNINLTIIGISSQFRSQVCECLKDVRGFNYFCAVKVEDIKKYVFQTFDFGFFPSAYDLSISLKSDDIRRFAVFGVPDALQVGKYNDNFMGEPTSFVITKVKSSFPSEIEIIDGQIYNYGGLILLKLHRKTDNPYFKGQLILKYSDAKEKVQYTQNYPLNYQFHPHQQFMSDDALTQALQGFTFCRQMKTLLQANLNTYQRAKIYEQFWPTIVNIQKIVPKSKEKDYQNVKKILQGYNKKTEGMQNHYAYDQMEDM